MRRNGASPLYDLAIRAGPVELFTCANALGRRAGRFACTIDLVGHIEHPGVFYFYDLSDSTTDNPLYTEVGALIDLLHETTGQLNLARSNLNVLQKEWKRNPESYCDIETREVWTKVGFDEEEDAFFEAERYESILEGLGRAIIMGADSVVKTFASGVGEEFGVDRHTIFARGPKANNASWADGVYVAANYFRHGREWHWHFLDQELGAVSSNQLIPSFLKTYSKRKFKNQLQANFKTLDALGISSSHFLTNSVKALDLIYLLTLDKWESAFAKVVNWFDDVHQFVSSRKINSR